MAPSLGRLAMAAGVLIGAAVSPRVLSEPVKELACHGECSAPEVVSKVRDFSRDCGDRARAVMIFESPNGEQFVHLPDRGVMGDDGEPVIEEDRSEVRYCVGRVLEEERFRAAMEMR